jgi:hypothetical protein
LEIPFIDLLPAFQEQTGKKDLLGPPLHYAIDGHWTEFGHHIASQSLAQYLLDNPSWIVAARNRMGAI